MCVSVMDKKTESERQKMKRMDTVDTVSVLFIFKRSDSVVLFRHLFTLVDMMIFSMSNSSLDAAKRSGWERCGVLTLDNTFSMLHG